MPCSPESLVLARLDQRDVTGTVNLADPAAVSDAVCAILARRYDAFDDAPIRQAFIDIVDAFWGRYPGLLACDTPYHDLRHSLSTALLMARMVDGHALIHEDAATRFGCRKSCLAVLLALFHDIGFLRRSGEEGMNGACLIHAHEERGVEFMRNYLARGDLREFVDQAELIHATNFGLPMTQSLRAQPAEFFTMGQMLGAADLVSQIGGRYYLERCRYFLYQEFVAAGVDRTQTDTGEIIVLYASGEDLLRKTPGFYEHVVKRRLEQDFAQVHRFVAAHFDGYDPYARAMENNLRYLNQLIQQNDFSRLRRKPVPLMPASEGLGNSLPT